MIDWHDAFAHAAAGRGTLLASDGPWDLGNLWWSEADQPRLDPNNYLRKCKAAGHSTHLDCAGRRRLEEHMGAARPVRRLGGRRFALLQVLNGLPCVQIDYRLDDAGLTGEPSDPLSWPIGDLETDALRAERGRLLDLFDPALGQGRD